MKFVTEIKLVIAIGTTLALTSCAKDPNVPATPQDQAAMMRGHAPTPDQLSNAMKNYHGLSGPPPKGGAAPGPTPPAVPGSGPGAPPK